MGSSKLYGAGVLCCVCVCVVFGVCVRFRLCHTQKMLMSHGDWQSKEPKVPRERLTASRVHRDQWVTLKFIPIGLIKTWVLQNFRCGWCVCVCVPFMSHPKNVDVTRWHVTQTNQRFRETEGFEFAREAEGFSSTSRPMGHAQLYFVLSRLSYEQK